MTGARLDAVPDFVRGTGPEGPKQPYDPLMRAYEGPATIITRDGTEHPVLAKLSVDTLNRRWGGHADVEAGAVLICSICSAPGMRRMPGVER